MQILNAAKLLPLVNGFTIKRHPSEIIVPRAKMLAKLQGQEITLNGKLLKKQIVSFDPQTNNRVVRLAKQGYHLEKDGDVHLSVGNEPLAPHLGCEIQRAKSFLSQIKAAVDKKITLSGFFRCLFEHSGFMKNEDAHIFEIHPVRSITLDGALHTIDVYLPDQESIHSWTDPVNLVQRDKAVKVKYDSAKDTLHFLGVGGREVNYVKVKGKVSKVKHGTGGKPTQFTFTSSSITKPLQGYALLGTSAAKKLAHVGTKTVELVALRNIGLTAALAGKYVINLLAIDFQ